MEKCGARSGRHFFSFLRVIHYIKSHGSDGCNLIVAVDSDADLRLLRGTVSQSSALNASGRTTRAKWLRRYPTAC